MASISAHHSLSPLSQPNPNLNSHKLFSRTLSSSPDSRFLSSSPLKKSSALSPSFNCTYRSPDLLFCRCTNRPEDPPDSSPRADDSGDVNRWDLQFQSMAEKISDPFLKAVKLAEKTFQDHFKSSQDLSGNSSGIKMEEVKVLDWDWDRWSKHFDEIEEQERIVSILKSQLGFAVQREDYNDAAKLKVAIAAAAANDTVGSAISRLDRAVEEERYQDAAFIRDQAGAGLVGWWTGISDDPADPYGRIINISAAYGRFVARSYSYRQLATAKPGLPLFEIYVTVDADGEYKLQVVYLKRNGQNTGEIPTMPFKPPDTTDPNPSSKSTEDKNNVDSTENFEELEDDKETNDDADMAEGLTGVLNILRDMIPGAKVKVLKVMTPRKADGDLISKVFEPTIDEEDEEEDVEVASVGPVDEVKADSSRDEIDVDVAGGRVSDISEEKSEIAIKLLIGGLVQKLSGDMSPKAPVRIPANIEQMERSLFSFCLNKDINQQQPTGKGFSSSEKSSTLPVHRPIDRVTSDLAKVLVSGEKIPVKVLKDVGEFINHAITQAQNRKALSGHTIFHRIVIPTTSDPLNGLYIGAHGPYSSEVIQLRCRFGQWKEDGETHKSSDVGFYKYVEAFKLTGDPYVPAGQVAFRAKVGKRNQLPHKGIIPEELGVVARYKGQGRLAEPGFQNPRWVDGELVILDGKHIKSGPMVGFVYWAPEYHFLVFFSRLKLEG